jgi:NAD(P)H-hydrate epimerase
VQPAPPFPLTRDEVREVDRLAIEELGIPGVVLMENAGLGAAGIALELLGEAPSVPVVIVCGGGNNGGDGWVVARHLDLAGVPVVVATLQPRERARGDAAVMREIVERTGLRIVPIGTEGELAAARADLGPAALVVDALLGTGFRDTGGADCVRADTRRAIDWISELSASGASVLALDVPSGLDCDTGRPSASTVRADRTATFVAPKIGFGAPEASPFLGRVEVVSIGAPTSLVQRVLDRRGGGSGGRGGVV